MSLLMRVISSSYLLLVGATCHIVNEDFLKQMKTSVLVNASRGTLVDSDALAKALKEGWN